MQHIIRSLFALLFAVLAWLGPLDPPPLFAQRSKLGLSPQDQQKYDDLIRSAKRDEMIAYVAIGVGVLFVVAGVPLAIYLDRKKKARKKALQTGTHPPEQTDPLRKKDPSGQA
jgi:hypothetical protein